MRYVLKGGSVLHGAVVDRFDVALQDGTIVAIAPPGALEPVPGEQVYDVHDTVIMPGLHMCHWHPDFGYLDYDLVEVIGAKYPPGVQTLIASRSCDILLGSGFTSIAGAGCSNDIDAALHMAAELGIKLLPRIYPSGTMVATTGELPEPDVVNWWEKRGNLGSYALADGPDEMRKLVRTLIKRGAKIIKMIYSGGRPISPDRSDAERLISLDELHAIVDTAHERGCKVRAHVAYRERIIECIEAGVDLIDHGDETDADIAALMGERGTFWVPSALFLHRLVESHRRNGKFTEGDRERERILDNMRDTIGIADVAGARILLGDDYGFAFLEHRSGIYGQEITMWTRHFGFPAADVLRWATANGAELHGLEKGRGGEVVVGAVADLIVLREDPLQHPTLFEEPEKNIGAVIVRGQFYSNHLQAVA